MPGMSGYEFLKAVREKPTFDHIPCVAITAHAMASDRDKVLNAGFDGYLSKPVFLVDLPRYLTVFADTFHQKRSRPTDQTQLPSPTNSTAAGNTTTA
jgi:CheY-like chemotaxis protein